MLRSPEFFPLLRVGIIVAGALILLFASIFSRRWTYASWVKVAFLMLAVAGVGWGALRTLLLLHGDSLSPQTFSSLTFLEHFLLGASFALLALFFFSGEAQQGLRRWKELKKSEGAATPKT